MEAHKWRASIGAAALVMASSDWAEALGMATSVASFNWGGGAGHGKLGFGAAALVTASSDWTKALVTTSEGGRDGGSPRWRRGRPPEAKREVAEGLHGSSNGGEEGGRSASARRTWPPPCAVKRAPLPPLEWRREMAE